VKFVLKNPNILAGLGGVHLNFIPLRLNVYARIYAYIAAPTKIEKQLEK